MAEPNEKPEAATADNGRPEQPEAKSAKVEPTMAELAALRERLEAAEKTRDEYLKLAKSARADFENYQARARRDQAEERRYAQLPLAHDLLGPLDNLERATLAARQSGDNGALARGVSMVVAQLVDVLRRHGVTRIEAQGQPFDPNLHQAVMQEPGSDLPPNTVTRVLEHGYMIHERVLRPARVAVSAAAAPAKS